MTTGMSPEEEAIIYKYAMREQLCNWFSGFQAGIGFFLLLLRLGAPAQAHGTLNLLIGVSVLMSALFWGMKTRNQKKIAEYATQLEQRKGKENG